MDELWLARVGGPPRGASLPPGWPLYLLIVGYPLWWVLGLSNLIWTLVAIPMLVYLVSHKVARVPRWFGIWLLFLTWILLSSLNLSNSAAWLSYTYRTSTYLAATITLVYLLSVPREVLPTRRIVMLLTGFWVLLLAGGYLGLLFARVSFPSLLERLLPQGLVSIDFVYSLVHPRFAEVQNFIGYTIYRPSAPFFYTNWWGGNFGALLPIAIAAFGYLRSRRTKLLLALGLASAIPPIVLSVNRGLWVSLALGLSYAMVRLALQGRASSAGVMLGILMFVGLLLAITPLHATVEARLAHPASDRGRFGVIEAAIEGARQAPLVGHGVPQPAPKDLHIPTVGTGGLIWQVLYTTGIPGAAFFVAWLVRCLWGSRKGSPPIQLWAHVGILIIVIQMVSYSMIPVEVVVLMILIALAFREAEPTFQPYTAKDLPVRETAFQ